MNPMNEIVEELIRRQRSTHDEVDVVNFLVWGMIWQATVDSSNDWAYLIILFDIAIFDFDVCVLFRDEVIW